MSGTLRHFVGQNCKPRTQSEGHALRQKKRQLICTACDEPYKPTSYNQEWCFKCLGDKNTKRRVKGHRIPQPVLEYMLELQESKCKICREPFEFGLETEYGRKNVAIEHDHVTGAVRGLTCVTCNAGLSYLDNEEWAQAAIKYKQDVPAFHETIYEKFPTLRGKDLPRFPKL